MERYTLILFSLNDYQNVNGYSRKSELKLVDITCSAATQSVKPKCYDKCRDSVVYSTLTKKKKRFLAFCNIDDLGTAEEEGGTAERKSPCRWQSLEYNKSISDQNDTDVILDLLAYVYKDHNLNNSNESESETCSIGQLHELADNLSLPGSYWLEVIWACFSKDPPSPVDCVPLYGFLKRLELWHQAKISFLLIGSSGQEELDNEEADNTALLDAWRCVLDISTLSKGGKNLMIRDDILWSGKISIRNKEGCDSHIPGFQLRFKEKKKLLEGDEEVECDSIKFLLSQEIEIFRSIEENEIDPHILCPLDIQLTPIYEDDGATRFFMDTMQAAREKELCFLACLFYDDNAFVDEGKLTKLGGARWHEYIMSKDTTFLESRDTKDSLHKRCMMLIRRSRESYSLDVYLFKDQSRFSSQGASTYMNYEIAGFYKKQEAAELKKSFNPKWKLGVLSAEDLIDAQISRFEEIRGQLKGFDLDDPVPEDFFGDNMKCFQEDLEIKEYLELDNSYLSNEDLKMDFFAAGSISPSLWPERVAWINQEKGSLAKRSLKRLQSGDNHMKLAGLPVAAEQPRESIFRSLSHVLDLFKDSGEAVSQKLQPIPVVADRLLKQLPSEDTVKKLEFKEATYYLGHGIEYCLDSQNAVKLDAKLTRVQNRFISDDTSCTWTHINKPRSSDKMDVNSHFSKNPQNGASLIQRVAKNNKLPMKKEISKTNASTSEKEMRETCSKDIDKSKESKRKEENTKKSHKRQTESRSQRHQRRLKIIVEATVQKYGGIKKDDKLFKSCVDRLYSLCKSFLKDLKTSEGLVYEMKRLAKSNVQQVVDFELRSKRK